MLWQVVFLLSDLQTVIAKSSFLQAFEKDFIPLAELYLRGLLRLECVKDGCLPSSDGLSCTSSQSSLHLSLA
jgi:hypothetical protein